MAHTKHIAFHGTYTNKTFNDAFKRLWGASARLRGLEPVADPGGTLTLTPGAFIDNGVVVEITAVQAGVEAPLYPLPVSGPAPYAIVAKTQDGNEETPVSVTLVSGYNPESPPSGAILAYTDPDSPGTVWISTTPLGIKELADLLSQRQLSSEEVRILTNQDGNIDNANLLHSHRGLIQNKAIFETLTNLNYDQFPHTPLARVPVAADSYHTHENLPTNAEIELLTARGGVQSADLQHTHDNIPSDEAFAAVFGGANVSADNFHSHPKLTRLHGVIVNPEPTLYYVPQNIGTGDVYIDGLESNFQGSIKIILGNLPSQGAGINAIVGVQYKDRALFFSDKDQSSFGNCTQGTAGSAVQLQEDTFGANSIFGVTSAQPFNTTFVWRGIRIKSVVPGAGAAFVEEDYFIFNGIIRNTAPAGSPANGSPADFELAHERELSLAGIIVAPVLDRRFREGGYWTIPYL